MGIFKKFAGLLGGSKKFDLNKLDEHQLAVTEQTFRIKGDEWSKRMERKQRKLDMRLEDAVKAGVGARRDNALVEAQGLKREIKIGQSVQNKYRYLQQVFKQVRMLREGNAAEAEVRQTLSSLKLDLPQIRDGMIQLLSEMDAGRDNLDVLMDLPMPSFEMYEDQDLADLRSKVERMVDDRIDEGGEIDAKSLEEMKRDLEKEIS